MDGERAPGFTMNLLRLAGNAAFDTKVRLLAATHFKNVVKRNWNVSADSEEEIILLRWFSYKNTASDVADVACARVWRRVHAVEDATSPMRFCGVHEQAAAPLPAARLPPLNQSAVRCLLPACRSPSPLSSPWTTARQSRPTWWG